LHIGIRCKLMNDVERSVACVLVASYAENVLHGSIHSSSHRIS
jgi:hypothetical protein